MTKSVTTILMIITVALLVATTAFGGIFLMSFIRDAVDIGRKPIVSGQNIEIESNGYMEIFIEFERGAVPASFNRNLGHGFHFTNVQTGEVVAGREFTASNYNLFDVQGFSVSRVYLTEGIWQVVFTPASAQGGERFVMVENFLGGLTRDIVTFTMQMVVVSFAFMGLCTVLVLLILKRAKLKIKEQTA